MKSVLMILALLLVVTPAAAAETSVMSVLGALYPPRHAEDKRPVLARVCSRNAGTLERKATVRVNAGDFKRGTAVDCDGQPTVMVELSADRTRLRVTRPLLVRYRGNLASEVYWAHAAIFDLMTALPALAEVEVVQVARVLDDYGAYKGFEPVTIHSADRATYERLRAGYWARLAMPPREYGGCSPCFVAVNRVLARLVLASEGPVLPAAYQP